MPALAIGYELVPNVHAWVAVIQGTDPPLYRTFLQDVPNVGGAAPGLPGGPALAGNEQSTAAVQRLANAMQQGNAAVTEQESQIFVTGDGGPEVESLFTTTDTLTFGGEFVIATVPNADVGATQSLLDILEDAGERLALVLLG